jgi:hypothetical protein
VPGGECAEGSEKIDIRSDFPSIIGRPLLPLLSAPIIGRTLWDGIDSRQSGINKNTIKIKNEL